MKTDFKYLFFILITSVVLTACSSVPVTGRKQLNIIPSSQMMSMSYQQYDAFLKSNKLSTNAQQTQMVKTVGAKIKTAVETYFRQQGMSSELNGYSWEFNLIESPEANAWCMPGGKVVFYTGILPITKDETGLAVVMGHEIAHAVAEHGNERMSQSLISELGGVALAVALQEKPAETQQLWLTAYGIGNQVGVMLPFSRLHESEADRLGLIFMAMAGYNPNEAVGFWQRMADKKNGQSPPEFLSTHPSDATRIRQIKSWLPEAMTYYKK
ncbi:MAG: M48 family metallopeptidase [Bacteroidales bacterium]|jgi:predicted Zn-dependent protease|nr:M48 family metallopeptidase [Bacteroidales bacterium]